MSLGAKLVIAFSFCLALNYQALQANPVEKRDASDWFSALFDYDDSESEEYLICRNCTIMVVQQGSGQAVTSTVASTYTPATAPPTVATTATPPPPPSAVPPATPDATPAPAETPAPPSDGA